MKFKIKEKNKYAYFLCKIDKLKVDYSNEFDIIKNFNELKRDNNIELLNLDGIEINTEINNKSINIIENNIRDIKRILNDTDFIRRNKNVAGKDINALLDNIKEELDNN